MSTSQMDTIKKTRDFIFSDLDKGIQGGANFMVALALCAWTEYWGRLVKGIPKGCGRLCFNEFFARLGPCYQDLITRRVDVYDIVRCGLVHEYAIKGSAVVNMGTGNCGLEFKGNAWWFNLVTYSEDFKKAVDKYIQDVQCDSKLLEKLQTALKGKPVII